MSRRRVHYRARGMVAPRGICGRGWLAAVTRALELVTCRSCLERLRVAGVVRGGAA
jgi:hypothetical protein